MSFDALKASDVGSRTEKVEITVGDKTFTFTAKEVSYLQRLHLASIQSVGGDAFTQLVVYSIVDESGKHMSQEQARSLSPEHAAKLFFAASNVNQQENAEKN